MSDVHKQNSNFSTKTVSHRSRKMQKYKKLTGNVQFCKCQKVMDDCFYSVKIGETKLYRNTMYCDSLFDESVWTTKIFEQGDIYYFAKTHMRLWSYGIECYDKLATIQLFLIKKIPIIKEKNNLKKNILMLGKKEGTLKKLPADVISEVYKFLYGLYPIPNEHRLTGCVHSLVSW
jgi:hypothetical protein